LMSNVIGFAPRNIRTGWALRYTPLGAAHHHSQPLLLIYDHQKPPNPTFSHAATIDIHKNPSQRNFGKFPCTASDLQPSAQKRRHSDKPRVIEISELTDFLHPRMSCKRHYEMPPNTHAPTACSANCANLGLIPGELRPIWDRNRRPKWQGSPKPGS
jgi:hypothetical protein